MNRVKIFAVLALLSTVALLIAIVGRSGAGPDFDVTNGTAVAAADHLSAGNDAFPNFATGAVDNRYPLASAHVDNSSAQGYGSPLDTGPLGQTAAANGHQNFTQPQYANAQYPPKAETVTVGRPPAAYATAKAGPNSASADSAAARSPGVVPTSASARSASIERLNQALLDWRNEFLTADDKARYPFVGGDAAAPDGGDGLSAFGSSVFDPNAGVLTVDSDARASHASFGGGAIAFNNVHIHITITSNGTPQRKVDIDVGGSSIGGVPVTVGRTGVSVAGTAVPGTAGLSDQANAGLNQALASAGFTVYTVAPAITSGPNTMSVDATAIRVRWQGGDVQPGVPRSFVQHDLGEAFAFSLAVPSTAVPTVPSSVVGGITQNGPTTTFIPGTAGTPGTPGSSSAGSMYGPSPTTQAASAPVKSVTKKPLWLLLLYLCWQFTIIGAAASLAWWRMDRAS